jgi:cellobiose phosphorylase
LDLNTYYKLFAWPTGFALLGAVMVLVLAKPMAAFSYTSFFLFVLWSLAPALAWRLSQPSPSERAPITPNDRTYLMDLAKQIGSYFDTFETPENHWLPPDNVQEEHGPKVAQRTSPTNIGLSMLSSLSSWDLGFLSTESFLEKLQNQFSSLNQLERYRGHFLNWYDTLTLQPLLPKYVSTVDSGNFVASLYVIKAWLMDLRANEQGKSHTTLVEQLLNQLNNFIGADFTFLYDTNVKLFTIGYNVSDSRRDSGYYDLLASESRLTSYLAIVTGQVPMEHWFVLGRSITSIRGKGALLSWSGSMFEYLMPNLYLPLYKNTLLEETCSAALDSQKEYGRVLEIPWGMSESGFTATDQLMNYQYRAFGVPELGLKRDLQYELVIAPYATVLALTLAPRRAISNLKHLEEEGFRGQFGFYEAIDYTSHRLIKGERCAVVRSFMAHHQGMSMVALTNLLRNDIMIQRFLSTPEFQAFSILLQEVIPDSRPIKSLEYETQPIPTAQKTATRPHLRECQNVDTKPPQIAVLSNGSYHTLFTSHGLGYSRRENVAITPWRNNVSQCRDGLFFYISDLTTKQLWSNTYEPTQVKTKVSDIYFSDSRIELVREHQGLHCKTNIAISPVDSIEVRSLTLTNTTSAPKRLKITSYAEIAMAPNSSFISHPAFSKLFIETTYSKKVNALIGYRRRRSPKEGKIAAFQFLVADRPDLLNSFSYETDRLKFIGRTGSLRSPQSIDSFSSSELTNTVGATLDPIMSLQTSLMLPPNKAITLHYFLGAADSEQQVESLVAKYSDLHTIKKITDMAWTHSQSTLNQLGINEEEGTLYNKLIHHILSPQRARGRALSNLSDFTNGLTDPGEVGKLNISNLWQYGISGDRPIFLVSISSLKTHELVRQVLKAHRFFRSKGVLIDLILLSTEEVSYRHEITDLIKSLVSAFVKMELIDRPEGVYVRRSGDLKSTDKILLKHVASLNLFDTDGPFEDQVTRMEIPRLPVDRSIIPLRPKVFPLSEDTFDTEYCISIDKINQTPQPWVNVIANAHFGTVLSERGASYTWFQNAHEYRISPWFNDPVEDKTGEILLLRDEETGEVWSPLPLFPQSHGAFVVKHGFGYSRFESFSRGLHTIVTIFVAMNSPVKVILLEVKNQTKESRTITATYFVDLVLGEHPLLSRHHILTDRDPIGNYLYAQNPKNVDFAHCLTFLKSNGHEIGYSCDQTDFIGYQGQWECPRGLQQAKLSNANRANANPGLASQCKIELSPLKKKELSYLLGAASSPFEIHRLIETMPTNASAFRMLNTVKQSWKNDLTTIQISSNDPSFDLLCNGWLLYQTMSARLYGRSGFYQSGGAYGFRDQLQDAMALIYNRPDLLRGQILRCASAQFMEGDVLHWWHPPLQRGVRTHISDDLLWLPLAVSRYIEVTGEMNLLEERISFLQGPSVPTTQESIYMIFEKSDQDGSIYDHCVRALRRSFRFGRHGLPLMGGGDWNDGMNEVGHLGRGESVWLAFFLHEVISQFIPVARLKADTVLIDEIQVIRQQLATNIELNAWDGEWYRRAYFDDGSPLGSSQSAECQIDLLPQCWSVLAEVGSRERMHTAMQSVEKRLIDKEASLIRLLDPPFDDKEANPGYIKGYIPGTRENGAQYTHAAVWTVMAFVKLGLPDIAWTYFSLINPILHAKTREELETYKVEPYVVAADVYSRPPHRGRGGWTWYTGSASWMYRLLVEYFIGLELKQDHLIRFKPCLPKHLNNLSMDYRYGKSVWTFNFQYTHAATVDTAIKIEIDGGLYTAGPWIELKDDGQNHRVIYSLAASTPPIPPAHLSHPSVATTLATTLQTSPEATDRYPGESSETTEIP